MCKIKVLCFRLWVYFATVKVIHSHVQLIMEWLLRHVTHHNSHIPLFTYLHVFIEVHHNIQSLYVCKRLQVWLSWQVFKQVFSTGLPTFKSRWSCFAMKTAILIFDGCPCLDVLHSKYSVVLALKYIIAYKQPSSPWWRYSTEESSSRFMCYWITTVDMWMHGTKWHNALQLH